MPRRQHLEASQLVPHRVRPCEPARGDGLAQVPGKPLQLVQDGCSRGAQPTYVREASEVHHAFLMTHQKMLSLRLDVALGCLSLNCWNLQQAPCQFSLDVAVAHLQQCACAAGSPHAFLLQLHASGASWMRTCMRSLRPRLPSSSRHMCRSWTRPPPCQGLPRACRQAWHRRQTWRWRRKPPPATGPSCAGCSPPWPAAPEHMGGLGTAAVRAAPPAEALAGGRGVSLAPDGSCPQSGHRGCPAGARCTPVSSARRWPATGAGWSCPSQS